MSTMQLQFERLKANTEKRNEAKKHPAEAEHGKRLSRVVHDGVRHKTEGCAIPALSQRSLFGEADPETEKQSAGTEGANREYRPQSALAVAVNGEPVTCRDAMAILAETDATVFSQAYVAAAQTVIAQIEARHQALFQATGRMVR